MTTSLHSTPARAIATLVLALSTSTAMAAVGDGFWHTAGGTLRDAAGNVVHFSGTNWNGMDSPNLVPHRLWGGTNHTIEKHLDEMKAAGLNLIRLPFSSEIFIPGQKPLQNAIDSTVNADLLGRTCLEILDRIVASAGQRGIRIILDYHRRVAGSASEDGLWYDGAHPDSQWIANWVALVGRYKNDPTVVGGDLFNEVHAAVTWNADGVDPDHNWRWALKRCGNAILAVNPHFLICAQGLDQYQGEGAWWGEVHTGENDFPLTLDVPGQLLYEIHDYGPVVWDQPFHQVSAGFPGNLPGFWDHMWGHLFKNGTGPVWVGEWGSFLNEAEAVAAFPGNTTMPDRAHREVTGWFPALHKYISDNQLSWTWWTWTPDSGDTGGLLKEDNTVNAAKVAMIRDVTYGAFAPSGPLTAPANSPPTAVMTATPTSGTAPLVVAFSASGSSDPDSDPLTFAWTFGDGGTATGATPSHTYATAGSFTATVTVSDGHGHNVPATRAITVSAPGGGGGGTGGGGGAVSGSQGGSSGCGSGFAVAIGLVMAFLGMRLRNTRE